MKNLKYTILLLLTVIVSSSLFAQQKVYVSSNRFATSILEKWASEFEKQNPDIDIVFVNANDKNADLSFVINSDNSSNTVYSVGRYALVPFTTSENPLLEELNKRRLNNRRLQSLFFEKDILEESIGFQKRLESDDIVIYSARNGNAFDEVFASHFGYEAADIKGKKILGDDSFLINAIKKEEIGITYNPLNYLFDINSKSLKEGLSLIPLDLKREQREALSGSLSQIVSVLENDEVALIPVSSFGFVSESVSLEAQRFISWVLTEGQTFNNDFGFLKVDSKVLTAQIEELSKSTLVAAK